MYVSEWVEWVNEWICDVMSEWVSEWVSEWQLITYSAISWREQASFRWDNDDVLFVLDNLIESEYCY